jgi:hypothetical protein
MARQQLQEELLVEITHTIRDILGHLRGMEPDPKRKEELTNVWRRLDGVYFDWRGAVDAADND